MSQPNGGDWPLPVQRVKVTGVFTRFGVNEHEHTGYHQAIKYIKKPTTAAQEKHILATEPGERMFLPCRDMSERTASKSRFAKTVHKSIHANTEAE